MKFAYQYSFIYKVLSTDHALCFECAAPSCMHLAQETGSIFVACHNLQKNAHIAMCFWACAHSFFYILKRMKIKNIFSFNGAYLRANSASFLMRESMSIKRLSRGVNWYPFWKTITSLVFSLGISHFLCTSPYFSASARGMGAVSI